jgi:hypothetical protein
LNTKGLLTGIQQEGLGLGNNDLPRTAAPLAADAFFSKSGATARRTLLGLGNWQVNILESGSRSIHRKNHKANENPDFFLFSKKCTNNNDPD